MIAASTPTSPARMAATASQMGASTPIRAASSRTAGAEATPSATVTLRYANTPNDANGNDGFNLIIEHNGVLSRSLVSIRIVQPQ